MPQGNNMKWGWKHALGVVVVAVIALGLATKIGHMAGEDAGGRAKDRLQLVWPSLMAMPEGDRALIVGLAMSCRLEERPAEPREVVACLREAAADPNAMLPKGTDKASVPAKLEQLLPRQS
jgi:hypothetical protein